MGGEEGRPLAFNLTWEPVPGARCELTLIAGRCQLAAHCLAGGAKLKVGTQMEGRKSSVTALDSERKGPQWAPGKKGPATLCSQDMDLKNVWG